MLTRESNRTAIESAIAALPADDPIHSVRFHYHDLSPMFLRAKKTGLLPIPAYYILWQRAVSHRFAALADRMDVVHHLTFCTLLCPGYWKLDNASFVLGPVGAPEVDPRYLPLFGSKAWRQRLRGYVLAKFLHLPWLRSLLEGARAVVPANSATRDLLVAEGVPARGVILDTGAPEVPGLPEPERHAHEGCRFIYAGQLERRKGLELSLRAFARAAEDPGFKGDFEIIGDGPDRKRLVGMVERLGLSQRVHFVGPVSRDEVLERFCAADAFLFSSVRDTSAGVNLEAMACGLPVVCLAHQGVADITTENCALRVPPGSIDATVSGLADAIRQLSTDRLLRERLGREARRRAIEDFSWDEKFDRMLDHYRECLRRPAPKDAPSCKPPAAASVRPHPVD